MRTAIKLASCLAFSLNTWDGAHAGAIVAAKNSPINPFDGDEAMRVFLGREASMRGINIRVIFQKPGDTRLDFESKVTVKAGAELVSYWSKQIFTGKAAPPLEVLNDVDVKAMVNNTVGAIGYISDAGVDQSIKVLYRY